MDFASASICLQERDFDLLRDLFESRIMTAAHIASLHFDDKREATKKRLQKLKAAGLIGDRRRKAFEPAILFLTRKAIVVLQKEGVLDEYPQLARSSLDKRSRVSELTIRHELEVMDVKAVFHTAIDKTGPFRVAQFSTWPLLNQFNAARSGYDGVDALVQPDGFIRIQEEENDGGLSEHTFFLEVDRSSETQDRLLVRAGCYLNYYKSGDFAVRNGASRDAYKKYPFRVLIVCKNPERRNNTAEGLLHNKPPIFSQVWLSTFSEVTTNPLGAIWVQPIDYREATRGTPFEPIERRVTSGYKRQSAREEFVERKVKKVRILADTIAA